jgi:hypothetical protein
MTDVSTGAPAPDSVPDTSNTGEEAGSDKGEGTTPEEVASILHLPQATPAAPAAPADEEVTPPNPDEVPALPPNTEEPAKPEPLQPEKPAPVAPEPAAPTNEKEYSLEVEDANGEKIKITVGDSLEDALKDFEPKNNGQIFQILRDLEKLEREKSDDEATKADEAAEAARTEQINTMVTGWNNEIAALQAEKRLEVTADGKDSERVKEVFAFMQEENDRRVAANLPGLTSFEDALDKLENREARAAKVAADKAEKEQARQNGGLVGGSSAPASSAPKAYVANSARNVNEAIRQQGLL